MQPSGSGKKAAETLRALQHNITAGVWPVNSRIPKEPELMVLLGVGKSTVREAVRSLASMGMLEPIKGVGTFVRSRTPVSSVVSRYVAAYPVEEILAYRRALELEAVQLAAINRTDEQLRDLRGAHERDLKLTPEQSSSLELGEIPGTFHHLIFEAAGNTLMSGLYSALMTALRSAIASGAVAHGSSFNLRHADHSAVLAAIEARDPARAEQAMRLHSDRDLVPPDALPAAELEHLSDQMAADQLAADQVTAKTAAR